VPDWGSRASGDVEQGGSPFSIAPAGPGAPRGVYAESPISARKFDYSEGRDNRTDLRVARMYLTGGDFANLPSPAKHFANGAYVGFYLQEVSEKLTEKAQLIPLNGDGYAAMFFGQEPTIFTFAGVLENSFTDSWRSTLTALYEQVLRGSRVATRQRQVQIAYQGKIVTGALISLSQVVSSQSESWTQFSFELLVSRTYDFWASREGDKDRMARAFIGDTSLFDSDPIPAADFAEVSTFTNTAFVAPPARLNRGGGTKVSCLKGDIIKDIVGASQKGADAQIQLAEGCKAVDTQRKISARLKELETKIADKTIKGTAREKLLTEQANLAEARGRLKPLVAKQLSDEFTTAATAKIEQARSYLAVADNVGTLEKTIEFYKSYRNKK
jgi:hypothetical protein